MSWGCWSRCFRATRFSLPGISPTPAARYQVHILPLLAIPVALGLQRLAVTARGRALAVVVFALSMGIQSLSVFATYHIEHFQATCDGMGEEQLLNSPVHGQLERRVQNLVRWAAGAPPPPLRDFECRSTMATMWDRYIPNFWGPV
jgi:hypothetical protein